AQRRHRQDFEKSAAREILGRMRQARALTMAALGQARSVAENKALESVCDEPALLYDAYCHNLRSAFLAIENRGLRAYQTSRQRNQMGRDGGLGQEETLDVQTRGTASCGGGVLF